MKTKEIIHSPLLPGGDLLAAVLDRNVMALADRGGASGMIGQHWADTCAVWTESWDQRAMVIPGEHGEHFLLERVVRLDAHPEVARRASKRGLQNPDWLFIGTRRGTTIVQAADAKFSVETARVRQVSSEVVESLLAVPDLLAGLTGPLPTTTEIVPGVFLCPDVALTHIMLQRRQGIVRVTVTEDDIELVPVPRGSFFAGMAGSEIMPVLADIDQLGIDLRHNFLASLYYFRLARAAAGCWIDSAKPLLMMKDQVEADQQAVLAEAQRRVHGVSSALDLILAWDADVQTVRAQRQAVEQVAGLPLSGKELRELIARRMTGHDGEAPSVNQVRRRLGSWYREALRAQIGPLRPPVAKLSDVLQELAAVGRSLTPDVHRQAKHIVDELIASRMITDDTTAKDIVKPN